MSVKRRAGYPPPKKSLGQVLLVDSIVAGNIVDSLDMNACPRVFEIGPGRGILTQYLVNQKIEVVACEIDDRMAELLKQRFGSSENFHLIVQNILAVDIEDVFSGEDFLALGNLPYHLTSEILFRFFGYVKQCWDESSNPRVKSLTVMIQKEVADRILSQPGKKGWGILSVYASLFGKAVKVLDVPADSFKPQPQVNSTVIRIEFNRAQPVSIDDYSLFRKVIKTAFGNRRKMLKNTLKSFNLPEDLNFDLHRRPEELTYEEFAFISNEICRIDGK